MTVLIRGVPQWLVIDGQQRLTTISLLLSALGRTIEARQVEIGIDRERIEDYYLFNLREEGELRYKQRLTQHDKETLVQLLERGQAADNSSPLVASYRFFDRQLKRADPVDLKAVYEGVQKLIIIDIVLNPQADDPQLIFESLNSKGTELSQADLIRNYVLLGQEPDLQNRLYETYWYPLEQSFGTEYAKRFDSFIRDYLTLTTQQIPNKRQVYESFKRYVADKKEPEALEAVIKEIVHYSKHYIRIALLEETDREFRACLADIHTLGVEVVFPYLLGIYEAYSRGVMKKVDVIEIFRLIESYVFRRVICGIPPNSLNEFFALLAGTVLARIDDETVHWLKNDLGMLSGIRKIFHFPSDNEFKQEFLIKDVYHLRICDYLLRKLESYGHEELIGIEDCTIEHVMPQKLTDEWQAELGDDWSEVHEKYLHAIGNLTLTGYNPELSNRSFNQKQEMPGGFRDSPLRLNRSLAQVERWNETSIVKRAEMLSEKACKIWIGSPWAALNHHTRS